MSEFDQYSVEAQNQINYFQILKEAFQYYKGSFQTFIVLGLLFAFCSEATLMVLGRFGLSAESLIIALYFLGELTTSWVTLAIILASHKNIQGKKVSISDALGFKRKRWMRFAGMVLALRLIYLIGMPLIIPAIYFAIIFIFSPILVAVKNVAIMTALRQSASLVRGIFWKALMFFLIVVAIYSLPIVFLQGLSFDSNSSHTINNIIFVFIVPFVYQFLMCFYQKVQKIKSEQSLHE